MFGIFRWLFSENENAEVREESAESANESVKIKKSDNYEIKENGDIKIRVEQQGIGSWCTYKSDMTISKTSIISHTKNSIVFKDYAYRTNCCQPEVFDLIFSLYEPIENKKDFIRYKDTRINTYEYSEEDKCWKHTKTEVVGTETTSEQTPLEIFKEEFKSKYKLIETEDEFNEYISSTLDCNTWCRKKLYNKMKELGLGDGFINQFADLVGNDLDKYYTMIDLANEVSDKDTLMYLYTYKFRENK